MRFIVRSGVLLIFLSSTAMAEQPAVPLTMVRSIDGAGTGGAAGTPLLRQSPASYPDDGSGETIYQPPQVPNARTISNVVVAQSSPLPNDRWLSDMVWAWGQFLDHDLDLTLIDSGNGTADIEIEDQDGDSLAPGPIPFERSDFEVGTGTPGNPRQHLNDITAFIDASNVYGSNLALANQLRAPGGKLQMSSGNLLPIVNGFFIAGDVRANENVGLTSLHTLFAREHNRLVDRIGKLYRDTDDDERYQLARKIVGAEMQIITYEEFLPALLGPMAPSIQDYVGFDPSVDPGISTEFSTAAYRFGHSMLSANLVLADNQGPFDAIPLRNAFFNPSLLQTNPDNVDYLLNGFSFQQAQEIDNMLVDDVRNFLFGPPGEGGLDLASLNIQRGRDHGLPAYNVMRMAYGLPPAEEFDEISSLPQVQLALAAVYESPDQVDAWVGGLAEDHVDGASVGPLVGAVLANQFTRLRDGDPFFYLNDPDLDHIQSIINLRGLRLSDVIRRNTKIKNGKLDVFTVANP